MIPLTNREVVRCKDSHVPLVSKEDFEKVQQLLAQKAPKLVHPRIISSNYLLSGLLKCGKCNYSLNGHSAKSGKFFYYWCNGQIKKGKTFCDTRAINKTKLESFIIERVKKNLLTDENIKELVQLVNREIEQKLSHNKETIQGIETNITENRSRIDKLLDALETGKLSVDEISPRVNELKSTIKALEAKRDALINKSGHQNYLLNYDQVTTYVNDLRILLEDSTLTQRKSFLRSFIKQIIVNYPKVTIEYTIPLRPGESCPSEEVLPIVQYSSPGRTRTSNLAVNSRSLYH